MQSDQDVFKAICPYSREEKAAIIEAAKKGGGKEAVREKMMNEYKIGRRAFYSIFQTCQFS